VASKTPTISNQQATPVAQKVVEPVAPQQTVLPQATSVKQQAAPTPVQQPATVHPTPAAPKQQSLDDLFQTPSLDDLMKSGNSSTPAVRATPTAKQSTQNDDPLADLIGDSKQSDQSELLSFQDDSKTLAKQSKILQAFNDSSKTAASKPASGTAQQSQSKNAIADDFFL